MARSQTQAEANLTSKQAANYANSYAQWIRSVMTSNNTKDYALIGSSFNEPLDLLKETLKTNFCDNFTDYYQSVFVNGNPRVVDFLSRHYDVPSSQLLCTTGATTALSLIYRTFTQPGDHVLIESPALDVFRILAEERALNIDWIERRPELDFAPDLDQLTAKITDQTKLIVLSNLHNPSGARLNDDMIRKVAGIAAQHGCLVVMDEVYLGYAEASSSSRTAAHLGDNIIAINSLTKTHGLSSLRCGWIIAAEQWLDPLRRFSDLHEYGISKIGHAIAGLVLEQRALYSDYREQQMAAMKPVIDAHLRELIKEGLINDYLPEYGCMYFPVLKGVTDTKHFADWLFKRSEVVITPGEYFGFAGAIRVGVPETIDNLHVALERLTAGIRAYIRQP
ncbi:pyridoxal phosphate-dependent aminotransferase [Pseudidiomarina salinarum]|uniref:pyridoxal phosphate-dependent aminotransferase n=1 Tax=Pseudidiomarina salinarum TaxID=435908 RepID=UPI00068D99AA|nr:pyridoxal phosphate-dependent aminotransferase [Pseudidiomarina salinarum]